MSDLLTVLPYLMRGLGVTATVFAGGATGAIVLSLIAGLMRSAPWAPLRWLAGTYIEIFRGTSVLVQLFWFGYVLPQIGDVLDVNLRLPLVLVGVVVLSMAYGAYGAELLRGAIRGIPAGQFEAAVALNFTPVQRMRRIILPQAILHMLPPMGNLQIELLKNTALVFFIGLNDITQMTKILRESGQDVMLLYVMALALYFAMALVITGVFRSCERIMSRGMRAGGAA